MTNKEAIKAIIDNYPPSHYSMLREGLDLAIKALEKQIPKKPIKDQEPFYRLGEPYNDWLCPVCNKWLAYECDTQRTSIHHCPCGQALDWT